jgi:hypothetical protein
MQPQHPNSSPSSTSPKAINADDAGASAQRIRYIEHAGKRILLIDLSSCTPAQLKKWIEEVPRYVTRQPKKSVLLLGDFTGTQFTKENIEQLKIAAVFDRPHVAKAAWVLSDNLHKVLVESIRTFSVRNIQVFSTREEALDYLAS